MVDMGQMPPNILKELYGKDLLIIRISKNEFGLFDTDDDYQLELQEWQNLMESSGCLMLLMKTMTRWFHLFVKRL